MHVQTIAVFLVALLARALSGSTALAQDYQKIFEKEWIEADNFFYNNLDIADNCGFITVLNNKPIGFICWDPRNIPDFVEIGHNCIASMYKGKKFGKIQLQEAISRISRSIDAGKIIVTTDERLVAAQKNYESVGFRLIKKRPNKINPEYAGMLIDYEIPLRMVNY